MLGIQHTVVLCKVNGVMLECFSRDEGDWTASVPWTLVSPVHTPDLTCFKQMDLAFLIFNFFHLCHIIINQQWNSRMFCVFVVVQTLEEPPYLTVGTDVSAKYRGAFCEAKIKTAKRLVKAKVSRERPVISAVWDHLKTCLECMDDQWLEKNLMHVWGVKTEYSK